MSDAMGGLVNLALVIFFIVVIALYMSYNVNYEKAFNFKNKIIDIIEENEGKCDSNCTKEINEYASSIGYGSINNIDNIVNNSDYNCLKAGFCIKGVNNTPKAYMEAKPWEIRCYFEVKTFVFIEIPVIKNLMRLDLFQPTGQTQNITISTKGTQTCQYYAKSIKD